MPVSSAYGGTVFSGWGGAPTDRDLQSRREMALLKELEEQAKLAEFERRKADPLENAKMGSLARRFQTRRGVREELDAPSAFTPEALGFTPASMASHAPTQPIRQIRRAAPDVVPAPSGREPVTTQFGTSPQRVGRIRRFTDQGVLFTDPDAAMNAEQRARLLSGPLQAAITSQGDVNVAAIKAGIPDLSAAALDRVAGADASLNTLKALEDALPTVERALGPLGGRMAGAQLVIPGLPVDKDFARFDANTATLKNSIVKAITGAQMSEPEAKRIMSQVPLITDKPDRWREKAAATRTNLSFLRNRVMQLSGAPPSAMLPEDTIGGSGGGQEFDFVPGKGLVPRGAR